MEQAHELTCLCKNWNVFSQSTRETWSLDKEQTLKKNHWEEATSAVKDKEWKQVAYWKNAFSELIETIEQVWLDLEKQQFLESKVRIQKCLLLITEWKERGMLKHKPLIRFLSNISDTLQHMENGVEQVVVEVLQSTCSLKASQGVAALLLLNYQEDNHNLPAKVDKYLQLRQQCLIQCCSSNSLESFQNLLYAIVTTLQIYENLYAYLIDSPEKLKLLLNSLIHDSKNVSDDILRLLFPNAVDMWVVDEEKKQYTDSIVAEWFMKIIEGLYPKIEASWKIMSLEQLESLYQMLYPSIDELLQLYEKQENSILKLYIEQWKESWMSLLHHLIINVVEESVNDCFHQVEEQVSEYFDLMTKKKDTTIIVTQLEQNYWRDYGNWLYTLWLGSDIQKFPWKEQDDVIIEPCLSLLKEQLQNMLRKTTNNDQSVDNFFQSVVIQTWIAKFQEFLQFLENKMDALNIYVGSEDENSYVVNSVPQCYFGLAALFYLFRWVKSIKECNVFLSCWEAHDQQAEWKHRMKVMEEKLWHKIVFHILQLSIHHILEPQQSVLLSSHYETLVASDKEESLLPKTPSNILLLWLMELCRLLQLTEPLRVTERNFMELLRLNTCSEFMKWLKCHNIVEEIRATKQLETNAIQLCMDLYFLKDICLHPMVSDREWKEERKEVDKQWKEMMECLESIETVKQWKQQVDSYRQFSLNRFGHLLGRLSISAYDKANDGEHSYLGKSIQFVQKLYPTIPRIPYLPAPTPLLIQKQWKSKSSGCKSRVALSTSLETATANITSHQRVDVATQSVGQQVGRFGYKFLESLKTYGSQYTLSRDASKELTSYAELATAEEQALLRCMDRRKAAPHLTKKLIQDLYVEGKNPTGSIILKALGTATRWRLLQDACYYYELSRELGLRPASAFYSNLVTLCGCRRDWNAAFRFYQEVIHEGVPPDRLLYRSLLFCCAMLGDSEKAKQVVMMMQQQGIVLDEHCHAILMECCRLKGDYSEGLALFENMSWNGTHRTFQVAFAICRNMNDYSLAMRYYQQFQEQKLLFSEISLSLLIDMMIQHEKWNEATQLFDISMERRIHLLPFIYFQYALALIRKTTVKDEEICKILREKPAYLFIPSTQHKALIAEAKSRGRLSLADSLHGLMSQERVMELKVESYAQELQSMGCVAPFGELKRLAMYRYRSVRGAAPPPPLWNLGLVMEWWK
eukprot:jgi/Galph1/5346/GphlegSOOS_G3987.1